MFTEQEKALWDTIRVFDKQGLLPYIIMATCKVNFIDL